MIKRLFKKIYYSFSFLLLLFFYLIQKLIFIRIGYYYKSKIGHLVANTQIYLYKKKLCSKFNSTNKSLIKIDLWTSADNTFFPVIENFYKKKIFIFPKILLLGAYNLANKFSFLNKFLIMEHDFGMDYYDLNYKNKSEIILNNKEIEYAQNQLKKISIFPKDKIACFINRNNFYNKNIIKDNSLIKINEIRNSDFNDYMPAARYLYKKGYKIIRMGSHDKNFKSKYVINYTSSSINNIVIDIFLLQKANLIISSSTGIDNVAMHFFKKPICFVNLVKYLDVQAFKFLPNSILLTKKFIKEKKFLSLKEIIKKDYFFQMDSKFYKDNSIKILNNTKKEILESVKEYYRINVKNQKQNKKKNYLQNKFYKIFKSELLNNSSYNKILGTFGNVKMSLKQKPRANFSTYFLKKNPWFLRG
jgi:putative glycosyltransferase (TIGR04372 family)